ncbi:MAG: T9SS type A sorting domain-containing protein [Elusimicrobiota bacterium]
MFKIYQVFRFKKQIISMLLLLSAYSAFAKPGVNSSNFNIIKPANSQEPNKIEIVKAMYMTVIPKALIKTKFVKFGTMNTASQEVKIIGKVLNYPNPFKLREGTEIGYELTSNADMEIQIYDMQAYKICALSINQGDEGGKFGYNRVLLNQNTFGGYDLSSGIYFYVIANKGKVLGKGKMSIIP